MNRLSENAIKPKTGDAFQATVVCVIIRDFIHLTEKLPPAKLADLMTVDEGTVKVNE